MFAQGQAAGRGVSRAALPIHLALTIRETVYDVHPLICEAFAPGRGYQLRKPDGTTYDIAQTSYGPRCDCPDFIFRREGLDPAGCKHVRALVAYGLIDGLRQGA